MNRFPKSGLLALSLLATVGLLSGCGASVNKTQKTDETHIAVPLNTSIPKAKSTIYNDLDAAAIVGALSLAVQTPNKAGVPLDTFIKILDLNISDFKKSKLDIAVTGNQLKEYSIGKDGSSGSICFVIKPPVVKNYKPGQAVWALYIEPKSKEKSDLVLVHIGLSTCAEVKDYANKLSNVQRLSISIASRSVIKDAIIKVPSSVLTPTGLALLDDARGITKTYPTPLTTASASK